MITKPDITPLLPSDDELAARREALATELAADLAANPRARRRPWLLRAFLGLVAIPLIGVGIATAAGVFSAEDMEVAAGIGCYSEAKLQPESITIIGARRDPVATCAKLWSEGVVQSGTRKVPDLVACTGEGEPVRVMPGAGAGACRRLGLVPLPGDYVTASLKVEELRKALRVVGQFVGAANPGGACQSGDDAVAAAGEKLRAAGFEGLPIAVRGDLDCAGHFVIEDGGLALIMVTRDQFDLRRLDARIFRALRSVARATGAECSDPEATAARARADLAKAGLGEIEVGFEGEGGCLVNWWSDARTGSVTLERGRR